MKFSESFLKLANRMLTIIVTLFVLIIGVYAVYALWDNNTVYSAAKNVQQEMLELKPGDGATFEELMAINPDVCAWVSLDGTSIDHPILQGETNLTYINTDVYREFALAGSIFLDTRSNRDFTDPYSLVYGHDMVEGRMFGDLPLYKEEDFFKKNRTGELLLPDRSHSLEIYAVILTNSSDEMIFNPDRYQDGLSDLINYAEENALFLHDEMTEDLKQRADHDLQIVSLTTCSYEFTDARTIVLTVME